MDQQSYYAMYGKPNLGPSLNYQMPFDTPCAEYQATSHPTNHSHQSLQTGLNFNSPVTSTSNCSISANSNSTTNYHKSSSTGGCNNNGIHKPIDISMPSYNGLYSSVISAENAIPAPNVVVSGSATSDYSNIVYGGGGIGSFNKLYDATGTSTASAANAVPSNNINSTSPYYANLNYGSYQDLDYGSHSKSANQYFLPSSTQAAAVPASSRNTHSINTSTDFTSNLPNEHAIQSTTKNCSVPEVKPSAKSSVIKPLNAYHSPAPLNYSKYVPPYPAYPINKTVPSHDKTANGSNRSPYLGHSTTGYKNTEVYYPEPISARYANTGYAVNSTSGAANTVNAHYLTPNNYLSYGHHPLTRHQNTVHHTRNMLPTAYPPQLDDNSSANFYNMQNSLLVRPTPNAYKQSQMPYQNNYGYDRNNSNFSNNTNNNNNNSNNNSNNVVASNNSHLTLAKPQTQKPHVETEIVNPIATFDESFDRHYPRTYNSVYGSNYNDPFEDIQYANFATATAVANPTLYPPKTSPKILYNFNNGLNMYNTTQSQSIAQPASTTSLSTSSVQQPVPINSSSSQLISSGYDTNSLHPLMPPPPLLNKSKDYCATSQYQHSSYQPQIMYPSLQTTNYVPPLKTKVPAVSNTAATTPLSTPISAPAVVNNAVNHHIYEKTLPPPLVDKYSLIDLEEQINSSKILKGSRTLPHCPNVVAANYAADKTKPVNSPQGNPNIGNNYNKTSVQTSDNNSNNSKNQFVYNYNAYNNCYQQQQWHHQPNLAPSAATSETLKKQSLRDFLSSWNEDEEEETAASGKKTSKSYASVVSSGGAKAPDKCYSYNKTKKNNFSAQMTMQPPPHQQQSKYLQVPALQSTFNTHLQPHEMQHHDNLPANTISPPKIHVGITVDNGGNSTHNLPDIIIDIEKPKVTSENECFERANVIQEVPKTSEKLYILDSIDVPISELNKYRHLSVVNKLPDNIVLPPPPPLKHEDSVSESLRFIEEVESNHARFFKNDFEMNVEYDDDGKCTFDTKDLVECKNITMVQNVKKIIRKYRKQREYMRKSKMQSSAQLQVSPPKEINSNLSTPLKSLSPAHDYNSPDSIMLAQCPVDLSVHTKETVDEFIDNLSMGTDDSESRYDLAASPLAEIMKLTSPTMNGMANVDKVSDHENRILIHDDNIAITEDSLPISNGESKNKESNELNDNQPCTLVSAITLSPSITTQFETLQNICIRSVNTEEFRTYFTENIINGPIDAKTIDFSKTAENLTSVDLLTAELTRPDSAEFIEPKDMLCEDNDDCIMTKSIKSPIASPAPVVPIIVSRVRTLRHLAMRAIRLNQYYLNENIKSVDISYEDETDRKPGEIEGNSDSNTQTVRTLQELAREVANTIYSFNVKPLQDICKLAIEKYNHLYLMTQMENDDMTDETEPVVFMHYLAVIGSANGNKNYLPSTTCAPVEATAHANNSIKSLHILAQECVDEFGLRPIKDAVKVDDEIVYISSESDSETYSNTYSTETESLDDEDDKSIDSSSESNKDSENESESICEACSQGGSSSESSSESENDMEMKNKAEKAIIENELEEKIKKENENIAKEVAKDVANDVGQDEANEIANLVEGEEYKDRTKIDQEPEKAEESIQFANEKEKENDFYSECDSWSISSQISLVTKNTYNPRSLKDLCKNFLDFHKKIIRYKVPSLKSLCDRLVSATINREQFNVPVFCIVNNVNSNGIEMGTSTVWFNDDQSTQDEEIFLCINSDFDEAEFAGLICGEDANVLDTDENRSSRRISSVEIDTSQTTDEIELSEQCMALQNILATPPPQEQPTGSNAECDRSNNDLINGTIESSNINSTDNSTYFFLDNSNDQVTDDFQNNIQYEETVPSLDSEDFMVHIEPFKKYLQNKYVQTPNYFKMMINNQIVKKYLKFQRTSATKSAIAKEELNRATTRLRLRQIQQRKRRQQKTITKTTTTKIAPTTASNDDMQLIKKLILRRANEINNKTTENKIDQRQKGQKNKEPTDKDDIVSNKTKVNNNRNHLNCNANSNNTSKTIKNNKKSIATNATSHNNNNNYNINVNDNTAITCDILELIAKKRNLKRKLSIIDREENTKKCKNNRDDYCYDEDGQISQMLSSFINNNFNDRQDNQGNKRKRSRSRSRPPSPPPVKSVTPTNLIPKKSSIFLTIPSVSSFNMCHKSTEPATPTITTTIAPELNTIPLELNRNISQEQKIREYYRKTNSYQRNILNKFANSIKRKKLNFEDILLNIKKIYKSSTSTTSSSSSTSSTSSSSTTSSSSSSSDSESSSSSSSPHKKSARRSKRKRHRHSRKSNTNLDQNWATSSSSSSSPSSSKHSYRNRSRKRKKSHSRKKTRKSGQKKIKKAPIPIFDIETIKRNALMGCAMHERLMHSKIPPQMPCDSSAVDDPTQNTIIFNQNQNIASTTVVGDADVNSSAATASSTANEQSMESIKIPYVRLYRSHFIDSLAQTYVRDLQLINDTNTIKNNKNRQKYKRYAKRYFFKA